MILFMNSYQYLNLDRNKIQITYLTTKIVYICVYVCVISKYNLSLVPRSPYILYNTSPTFIHVFTQIAI